MSAPTGTASPSGNISGYKLKQVSNFTPEMQNLFKMLLGGTQGGLGGGGLDWLSKLAGGDEASFQQTEAPMHNAFNQKLGDIGSRFANMGAVDSSAFQNATSGAASQFGQELGANRINLQQGALDRLLGLSQNLLSQRPHENILQPKSNGFMDFLGSILGAAGGKFGGGIGGGAADFLSKKFFG